MKAKGIFIGHNTPSSKNSKMMLVNNSKGEKREKPLLINSKTVMKYKAKSKKYWLEQKRPFRTLSEGATLPLVVGFHFVRDSKRAYDWINMVQICQDLMVEYKWIEDDNVFNLIPIPFKMNGQYSTIGNKETAGVWIVPITQTILNDLNANLNE